MPITILIAEDQRLFRQSLRMLLEHEPDLVVVGTRWTVDRRSTSPWRQSPTSC